MRLTNATLPDGSKHDIEVSGGRIAALLPASDTGDLDLKGALVLPPLASGTHARPKAATPATASLVPAYEQCTAPDRMHGPPLAFGRRWP